MKAALRGIAAVVLAYAAASAAVSLQYLVIAGAAWDGPAPVFRSFLAGFVITAMTAFPGYAGLRLALWGTASRQAWRFALAGGVNGLMALAIFQGRPEWEPSFIGMGLVAGAVYWWVEARIWGTSGQG